MLSIAMVHPSKKNVIPLCPEPIKNEKGFTKNDCEQKATKRLLKSFRKEHPHLRAIIVQDSLHDSGPNIQLIESLGLKYIIVCKRQFFSWDSVDRKEVTHVVTDKEGTNHYYRFANICPLNGSNLSTTTNYIHYNYTDKKGQNHEWAWLTNITVTKENVHEIMKGGRARWKIENEVFNTLKNQGTNSRKI